MRYQWSGVSDSDGYGFAIIHTARWCHHRKGELCKSPFPKGEKCNIENCVMSPQEMKEVCPEEFQTLMDERAALRAKLAAAEERVEALEWLTEIQEYALDADCYLDRGHDANEELRDSIRHAALAAAGRE